MDKLLKNITAFNNSPIIGKSSTEIIKKGLEVFKDLPGFINAAYFYLEPEDFDFSIGYSSGISDNEINKIFRKLVDAGGITKVLSSGEITNLESENEKAERTNHLVIPLIATSGIISLVLLQLEKPLTDTLSLNLCRIHANYLAVLLENKDLELEAETLKETTEQQVALKTKDIAQSTRELKIILDSVQAGIIIADKKNDLIIDLNMAASILIGAGKEQIVGTPRKNYFFFIEKKSIPDKKYLDQEGLLKTHNGNLIPIIRTIKELDVENMKYTIESFMDISERKRMEDALSEARFELEQRVEERTQELLQVNNDLQKEINDRKKAEEQLLKLYWAVEQSPISIIITDLKGTIEYVNSHFLKISHFKFKEAMGNSFQKLNFSENYGYLNKEIWENLAKGIEWHGEFQSRKKSGEPFWVFASFSPIRNTEDNITHYLIVQEDISERKRVEEELLAAKEKAEESDKLKSTLLANMSHEFRTPLIGILGFSQILTDQVEDKEQNEMVKEIHISGKRLLNTLNGVLAISELEAADISADCIKADLITLLKSGSENYLKSAKAKGLKFTSVLKKEKIISEIDVHLFQQALNNIIDNAIKYTDNGSVSVEADEVILKDGRWASIKIKDTGIGIPESDKEKIFEAFRQVSEGYTRSFDGCGLGLAISKKTIGMFGGHITLESSPSVGSEFTIWLPVSGSDQVQITENESVRLDSKVKAPNGELAPKE